MSAKNFAIGCMAAGLISLTACFSVQSQNTEQPRQDGGMTVSPDVPEKVTFCGEQIDLTRYNMYEAMELLAVSGKLGFDVRERAFFHRELPDDPDRVLKDNPRLVGAKKLVDETMYVEDNIWHVKSGETTYRVIYPTDENLENAKCTCTWYLKHQNSRGPCKHILAVKLKKGV